MKYDKQLQFSAAQAPATSGATASTNVIDTRNIKNQINGINKMYVAVDADTAMAGASPTMSIAIRSSATTSGGALSGTIVTHLSAAQTTTAGKQKLVAEVPYGCLRYLDVQYTVGGTCTDAGTWTAILVDGVDSDFPARIN